MNKKIAAPVSKAILKTILFGLLTMPVAHATEVSVNVNSETEVKGYTDSSKVEGTIDRKLYHLRNCYMDAVKKKPALKGTLEFDWRITSDGGVDDLVLKHVTAKNAEMEECMMKSIKEWQLPKPEKDDATVVLKLTLTGQTK